MKKELPKAYKPEDYEESIYRQWEESGLFNPDTCIKQGITDRDAEAFSIVLPPPNVTGTLHTGHAIMLAIEDALVRYNRMRGKRTLWIPGTDHAAIATQSKVEATLIETEHKTRHDVGREEFLKSVEAFAAKSHDTIVNQIRKMGASVDWSREAFTLDDARQEAVFEAFKTLYEMKLIYQGERIVNWDPKLQTTVSDDEMERVERKAPFYYLQYGPFEIATARPETKFGDKYVVMHPGDNRYKQYTHGQHINLEWINGPITATVIKDEAIDPEFGTGVMTITPWHDATDFDIAERHNLDKQQIIDHDGNLLPIAGDFADMPIKEAREAIVKRLNEKELITRVDNDYTHNIVINSRGGGIIEPQIMKQWFIEVNKEFVMPYSEIDGIERGETVTLKKLMDHAVRSGQITITPDRFRKVYFHWVENLRDWCISRQLWYGHRIPVYYCSTTRENPKSETQNPNLVIDREKPKKCPFCQSCEMQQDPDTLDTWFSSGLWTFSTLGWPAFAETAVAGGVGPEHDLANYHPTSILETGYDILFFWVARMILMTTVLRGQLPFRTTYLHGIVRDEEGRKMSKSLENVVDPLDLIATYGADALRMALVVGVGPGNDLALQDEKIKAYKHFANKLWNAARFVLINLHDNITDANAPDLTQQQRQYLSDLDTIIASVTEHIEHQRLHIASDDLYHYFWHTFADGVIEEQKEFLRSENPSVQIPSLWTLYYILRTCLIMLHPFMPFVTEAIWSSLPEDHLLIAERWPMPSSATVSV